jgi:hypothetical protein
MKHLNLHNHLNLTLIASLLFVCFSQLTYAKTHIPPVPVSEDAKLFKYKIGDTGPGGGWIFFVDYYNQYPGFTYLEAAPTDASDGDAWCVGNGATTLISSANWTARGVGKGKANTALMTANCTSGAAYSAIDYISTPAETDWFLPSVGELELMYTNLQSAGVGGFAVSNYWSSTEYDSRFAWLHNFLTGNHNLIDKNLSLRVRAVRAF